MKFEEDINQSSYAGKKDINDTVSPNHISWNNGIRFFSNKKTGIDGDDFSFIIYYYDWAGNLGEIVYSDNSSSRYNLPSIKYDDYQPEITNLTIESDNWNQSKVAKVDDNITLKFTVPSLKRNDSISVGIGQKNLTSYNKVAAISTDNQSFTSKYQLTNSDLEGMLDFEIIVRDQSGNTLIQRQNRKFINSCYVSDDLEYHTNNTSDCNANDWKKVISSSSSNCRTVSKLDVVNPLIGALDNTSYLTLDTYTHNRHNNDDIYYCDNESLQTTDQSFVIFDRTPPKPYIALTWPETGTRARKTKELGVLEWNKDERSLITEEISIYFKDLSGLLDSTSGLYKGYDNLVFNNGSSGLISNSKCSTLFISQIIHQIILNAILQ